MHKLLWLTSMLLLSCPARADFFGGDVAVLSQILSKAVLQLQELRMIVGTGRDTLGFMRALNNGINDSLKLYETAFPGADPGIFREWKKAQESLRKLQEIYGVVTPSLDAELQRSNDQGTLEAIDLNNSIYEYTTKIDALGEKIKAYSHDVSPGGAQKLTAQTLGIVLQVLNQGLRTQATSLKLQAQNLALANYKEKQMTTYTLKNAEALKGEMKSASAKFEIPRF